MFVLGFESSCDETSAAVLEINRDGREQIIRSNVIASQIDIHSLYGGVVPEIASRAHVEAISSVTRRALEEAGVKPSDIGLVAVTAYPGLIGALLVGVNFAKSLAFANRIPLVGVDHLKAHIAAAYIGAPEIQPPFLGLIVSGGHTVLFRAEDYYSFEQIGSTRDDAIGESFDKVARVMGMPYPGGAKLDLLATKGDPHAFAFPSPALAGDTLDFSFSGIKTAALNALHHARQTGQAVRYEDLAASYVHTAVEAIRSKAEKALKQTGAGQLVVAGGVAANSHLRASLSGMCKKLGVELFMPALSLCGDNAAMVASAGYYAFRAGESAGTELNASASDGDW
ncbi:MAG: tRNA (adenosine(37)-N6)-threonylcarbamoyltransferase complex transferase subunit TsaD [Clostridia bacterium]|nr:tRNA (adenosine(37)-N6)-threonylcarbamoyltransferase complex transferase subunit TsaD [Clostridia bacterium]